MRNKIFLFDKWKRKKTMIKYHLRIKSLSNTGLIKEAHILTEKIVSSRIDSQLIRMLETIFREFSKRVSIDSPFLQENLGKQIKNLNTQLQAVSTHDLANGSHK